ncbi:MCE family protein [bacterium]|nr:MCE family protein [bacterium]
MKNELKVGAALLLSLVIIVGGIMWGKGFRLQAQRYMISVKFTNTGGLEPGANVMANGVVKGRVHSIEFNEGYVLVTASLDNDVNLYSDYIATIESPTVMAGSALSIYTGDDLPKADVTQVLKGTDPQGVGSLVNRMSEFTDRLEVTLSNLDSVLISSNLILGDTSNRKNFARFVDHAASTAESTDELLKTNRAAIENSLSNLQAALASTRELTENLNRRSDSTLAAVDSAMYALSGVAKEVQTLVASINAGEGTVGKLVTDDELYQKLNDALAQIDSLSSDLRNNGLRHRIVIF